MILSRSRPPPRGPFVSSLPSAASPARSSTRQLALRIVWNRSRSFVAIGFVSDVGGMSGAPKSVVAFPESRSTSVSADGRDGGSNFSPVPRRTFAYRRAYARSVSIAAFSSRPLRVQPGQSTEPANTRLRPISRYTGVFGTSVSNQMVLSSPLDNVAR